MKIKNSTIYIFSPKSWGGVRSVAEGLKFGLMKNGINAILIDEWSKILNLRFIFTIIYEDIFVITSLSFGLLNFLRPSRSVYILHGYPRYDDRSLIMFFLILISNIIFSRFAYCTFSVSQLTRFINSKILGCKTELVLPNGLHYIPDFCTIKSNYILYAGKFFPAKNVLNLINGYKIYKSNGGKLSLVLCGDGLQAERILQLIDGVNSIEYLGVLGGEELKYKYKNAKVFASLNEGEPFGISILEAFLAGSVIVCPSSGGQIDFLSEYTNSYVLIDDVKSIYAISCALMKAESMNPTIVPSEPYYYPNIVRDKLISVLENAFE